MSFGVAALGDLTYATNDTLHTITVESGVALAYAVSGGLSTPLEISYSIREQVASTCNILYNIKSSLGSPLDVSWSVKNGVTTDLTIRWYLQGVETPKVVGNKYCIPQEARIKPFCL